MNSSRILETAAASEANLTDGVSGSTSARSKVYTREQVAEFLADIAKRLVQSGNSSTHCLLALNHLLTLPNANELFDKDLRDQARDLWVKLKSGGLQLNDPPLLFGADAKILEDFESDDSND